MQRIPAIAPTVLAAFTLTPSLLAQADVVGIHFDLSARRMFSSTTDNFVADWVAHPDTVPGLYYGIDFDASGTNLYALSWNNSHIGLLDEVTGTFTSLGATGMPNNENHGLTAHPDGFTWYAISVDGGGDTQLWRGSIGGAWTTVGSPMGVRLWDIACNSAGELYAESVVTDSLYSIDPVTGVETLVGPMGLNLQYAQGFDFDWSDDTLYATISLQLGGGSPGGTRFATIDTSTGLATVLADTTALHAQAEMAIRQGLPCDPVGVPFCDPNEVNSTGFSTQISACMPGAGESGLHLEGFNGPPTNFGYFLVGTGVNDPGVVISEGRMCLATTGSNEIGRYNVAGTNRNSIGQFDGAGVLQNLVGTSATGSGFDVPGLLPLMGTPAIAAGSTWHFQLWHRDGGVGPTASNFSNGLSVTF